MNMHVDSSLLNSTAQNSSPLELPEMSDADLQAKIESQQNQIENLKKQVFQQQAEITRAQRELGELHRQLDAANLAAGRVSLEKLSELEDAIDNIESYFFETQAQFLGCYYMADEKDLRSNPGRLKALKNMQIMTKCHFEKLEEPVMEAQEIIRSLNIYSLLQASKD